MNRPRVASVSYLNAKPLIEGLEAEVELFLDVPSRLLGGLMAGDFDVALLPVADVPGVVAAGGRVLPVGGIGCDGPTLTVRLFAGGPLAETKRLWCDTDSHTSVQLARVVLREVYRVSPETVQLPGGRWREAAVREGDAVLLIGDKVITDTPGSAHRFGVETDLGDEWKRLTGLPFVFAVWTARPGYDGGAVSQVLRRARERGMAGVEGIVARYAGVHHWPAEVARRYMTEYLRYEVGERELGAMSLFWRKAGLV